MDSESNGSLPGGWITVSDQDGSPLLLYGRVLMLSWLFHKECNPPFRQGVSSSRITIIPSGIDTARFAISAEQRAHQRAAQRIASNEIVVLTVGALAERKGHHTLLQAAAFLQQKGIQLRYLICGDGLLRTTLESETQTLGLAENVQFLGFCSDIVNYLAVADVVVHVPRWEGLGVAVIEALAAGLPVIASRVGGIPELIDNERSGLLVPPAGADSTGSCDRTRGSQSSLGQDIRNTWSILCPLTLRCDGHGASQRSIVLQTAGERLVGTRHAASLHIRYP